MNDIDEANHVLAGLVERLGAVQARRAAAEASVAERAFAAHAAGDVGAQKEISRLDAEIAKLTRETISLQAAVKEAERRVDAARAADIDAVERAKAREALALLASFEQRGEALDRALAKFVAEYSELIKDFRDLDKLGFAPTTHALIVINMKNAAATKLMGTELQTEFLAPYQRRDFRTVIMGWASNVRGRAAARLNRVAKAA